MLAAEGVGLYIVDDDPSVRTSLTRLLRAEGADPLKCEAPPPDPRIEELLQADPEDQRINITSDEGELGREGDATLTGNVRIRIGQRLLTADAAEIDATARSVRVRPMTDCARAASKR